MKTASLAGNGISSLAVADTTTSARTGSASASRTAAGEARGARTLSGGFRLTVVTDAWRPQINGVARTYEWLEQELPRQGVEPVMITPEGYRTIGMPTYPEIRLPLATPWSFQQKITVAQPDFVHIATEGPLGLLARRYCLRRRLPFSTCYHTRYPEYVAARFPVPLAWSYAALRRFHNAADVTLVATPELLQELSRRGFRHPVLWRRGIDVKSFAQGEQAQLFLPRPIFLFAGRIAVEKNLDAFLSLDLPGSKVLAGDGPERARLQAKYPRACFLGAVRGPQLGAIYRAADVFVFPSRTDTYGLVMAEALAAGTPVAAFPSAGAREIFGDSACGVLDDDLRSAALAALDIPRESARRAGARHSIEASVANFLEIVNAALAVHAA